MNPDDPAVTPDDDPGKKDLIMDTRKLSDDPKTWTEGPGKVLADAGRVAEAVSAAMADEGMLVISTVLGQIISLEASLITLKAKAQLPPMLAEMSTVLRKSAEGIISAEVYRAKRPSQPAPQPDPAAQSAPLTLAATQFREVSERIAADITGLMEREAKRMVKEQGAVSPAALLGGLMLSMYAVFMSIEQHAPEMLKVGEMSGLLESLNNAMKVFAVVVQEQGGPDARPEAPGFRD